MTIIGTEHVGRTAKTLLAGTNSHGTTEIATGAKVEIRDVLLPLSHLDGPERALVVVRDQGYDTVCTMEARHLQLMTDTVGPSSPVEGVTADAILAALIAKRDSYTEQSNGRFVMAGAVGLVQDLINGCTCKPGMIGHWGCPVEGHDVDPD